MLVETPEATPATGRHTQSLVVASAVMSKTPAGLVKIDDYFNMDAPTVMSTWGLTEEELRREFLSNRLVAHGRETAGGYVEQVIFFLPSLLRWVARKRLMPAQVRAKVEAAGGLDRLDRWRREQINLCRIDISADTMTLPDGTVMRDVIVRQAPRH